MAMVPDRDSQQRSLTPRDERHQPVAPQAWQPNAPSTQAVTVNVGLPAMPMMLTPPKGPPFVVRALWYLFVGWWLSALMIVAGYALIGAIVGIPLAFALFNRIPQAMTLRPRTSRYRATMEGGVFYLALTNEAQRPWYWRALYFLAVGWWFGAVWLLSAWVIGLLIITLPISFWMYNRTGGVMTLQRH